MLLLRMSCMFTGIECSARCRAAAGRAYVLAQACCMPYRIGSEYDPSRTHFRFGGSPSPAGDDRAARKLDVDSRGLPRRVSDDVWSSRTSRHARGSLPHQLRSCQLVL